MTGGFGAGSELYRAYRTEVEGARMARSVAAGAILVGSLNTLFIGVDYMLFPDRFSALLAFRILYTLAMFAVYFWTATRYPLASAIVGLLAIGAVVLVAIHESGGINSGYVPGLMLVFLGIPVLLPFTAAQGGWITGVLFGGLALLPILSDEALHFRTLAVQLVFPAAAAIECWFACSLLDRMRFSDFLQRREIEHARDELKELDREKSRFTANIHHELRTPLTLTLAPLEAMLGGEFGDVSEVQHGYLTSMHSNAQRLLKLINNLLDLAKIESEQLEIRRVPSQVGALVGSLVSAALPLAERKGVALEAHGLAELPTVNLDPDAFEKVVLNLLGNALKFTEAGGRIDVRALAAGEDEIHLVVADTGQGIPEDQLGRIFDRFAQVDTSGTRRHEGTGIGLALVMELMELHEGEIWAESEGLGRGTQIHLRLPIGEPDEELEDEVLQTAGGRALSLGNSFAAIEADLDLGDVGGDTRMVEMERSVEHSEWDRVGASEPATESAVPGDAPEVLVVEDNADMRRLLAHLIGREFRVRLARNGREGLEKVRESPPDLVLTDVMMPEMTGTELCAAIKADPELERIPVAIVTSKAEREMKIQGLELGADDYVTKPFHPRELMARVRGLVRVRRLQEVLAERNQALEGSNAELAQALTDLRQAHVQLVQTERLAAVGELAAGVAHEVNNPVNFAANALKTLRTYVADIQRVAAHVGELDLSDPSRIQEQAAELQKLRDELDFEETVGALTELVSIVTEGLDRTHRLVGDLRDFAAPGDGPRGEVDLRRGLETTVQLIQYQLRQARVEVQMDLATDIEPFEGDARALNQVFLNLLKNAAEALDGRGGKVRVQLRREEDSVLVEIRDDGPGIAPELRERLFEPFFTTKAAGRGTGLGLSISKRIVNEHGGTIELESGDGEGCSFVIRIPVGGHARGA